MYGQVHIIIIWSGDVIREVRNQNGIVSTYN